MMRVTRTSSEPHTRRDEEHFVRWLLDPRPRDPVALGPERRRLGLMLGRLSASETAMPPECCSRMGLAPDTSFGTAARWLAWAVASPEGPRCRSYRSAALFVHGLLTGTGDLVPDVREHLDADVAHVAAAAIGLAYSERPSPECAAELRRSADPAILRAARERLGDHTDGDAELVERARLLLADASEVTVGAR